MADEKVGFIGLGIMGKPMAANLIKAGYELVVHNRTRSREKDLIQLGAEAVASAADVARRTEIVITMVTDSAAMEDVVLGETGILEGIQPNSVVVDMSTISPAVEKNLDLRLGEKASTLVDAPVSGGDVGAKQGTLAIMAGGKREAFERIQPLFEVLGDTITYCGPVGNGQATKLCNQILVSVNLLAVCEAVTFARENDLNPGTMIEAVSGGAAGSWQLSNLGPRIVRGDFAAGFMIDLMQKDLRLVLEVAADRKVGLAAAALVNQLFNAAQAAGCGREGTQALAKVVEALSQP